MILKETMRVVLTAMKMLLNRRESRVESLERDIRYQKETAEHTRSAGARIRALNKVESLRPQLGEANKLAQEVRDAINELRATDVGADVWKELETT
jgi:hypothetical protein